MPLGRLIAIRNMYHSPFDVEKPVGSAASDHFSFSPNLVPRSRHSTHDEADDHSKPENVKDLALAETLLGGITEWRGTHYSEMGSLHLYETLTVQRDAPTRQFMVYLFDKAILCLGEDLNQPQSLRSQIMQNANNHYAAFLRSSNRSVSFGNHSADSDGVPQLKLGGRIYIRHINKVEDTSNDTVFSLTITNMIGSVRDTAMDGSCSLIFKDRVTLEQWEKGINKLMSAIYS